LITKRSGQYELDSAEKARGGGIHCCVAVGKRNILETLRAFSMCPFDDLFFSLCSHPSKGLSIEQIWQIPRSLLLSAKDGMYLPNYTDKES